MHDVSVVREDIMTASSRVADPPCEPAQSIIDEQHLGRMTLGDRSLEREVLEIFARQMVLMLKRITGAEPSLAAAAAHTLNGSARGIGAWRMARAAERLERAAADRRDNEAINAAIAELETASLEVRAAIGARFDNRWEAPQQRTSGSRSLDH
jgi:HPt (histidine-containing phosphotransfer) domain-containing protein